MLAEGWCQGCPVKALPTPKDVVEKKKAGNEVMISNIEPAGAGMFWMTLEGTLRARNAKSGEPLISCLLYTSDAADE